jgi:hypothetical protein
MALRYRVEREWPTMGGARMIPARTVVDTSLWEWQFLEGAVPTWEVTPLDQATRDFLLQHYPPERVAPVGSETDTTV